MTTVQVELLLCPEFLGSLFTNSGAMKKGEEVTAPSPELISGNRGISSHNGETVFAKQVTAQEAVELMTKETNTDVRTSAVKSSATGRGRPWRTVVEDPSRTSR